MWGFDENAVKVLENMKPVDESLIYKYAILLGGKTLKPVTNDNEVYFRDCCKSLGLGTFQEYIYIKLHCCLVAIDFIQMTDYLTRMQCVPNNICHEVITCIVWRCAEPAD